MRKYRLFGKIPVFDVILVLLIVALVVIALMFFKGNEMMPTESKTIHYVLELKNINNTIESMPQKGETVTDGKTNIAIGTVVSSEYLDFSSNWYNSETGELYTTEFSDRHTVRVVVEAKANISDQGIFVNNVRISIASQMSARMPSLSSSAIVMSIDQVQ